MCQLLPGAKQPSNYKGSSKIKISSIKHFLENSKTPSAITGLESKMISKMGLLKCGVALTLTVNSLCVLTQEFRWKHQVYFNVSTVLLSQQEIRT